MEAVGNDPTQAYLCAGVLQTLELSIAQRLHKSFSKNETIRRSWIRCESLRRQTLLSTICVPRNTKIGSAWRDRTSVVLTTRLIKTVPKPLGQGGICDRSPGQNSLRNTRRSIDIFNQRTSVLIQLFPPSIHSIPYWTDFLS